MLLKKEYFATFTPKEIADARRSSEVLVALSFKAGRRSTPLRTRRRRPAARPTSGRRRTGLHVSRSIEDPDGHASSRSGWTRAPTRAARGHADAATTHA